MAKFIRLHIQGEDMFANVDRVLSVHKDLSSDEKNHGRAVITFGGMDYFHPDESVEEIMRMIEEKENGNQH